MPTGLVYTTLYCLDHNPPASPLPCTVHVFRQNFTSRMPLEFRAFAPVEAIRRVTNGIPLGCSLFLPVHTVNCVQTLKAHLARGAAHGWVQHCDGRQMVRFAFSATFTLENAIAFHAFARLEALPCVTNGIPLGPSLLLPVGTVNCVQTLKASVTTGCNYNPDPNPNHQLRLNTDGI
jgi:hypothetical protein